MVEIKITISQQKYIKAVYELSFGGGVRVVDIAEKLGVSKTSASLAMSRLEKENLVYKDERRQVFLSLEGERHAVSMLDKSTIIQDFLVRILSVDKEIAAVDACAIERVVSMDTLCALCRFVRKAEQGCTKRCHIPNTAAVFEK